MGTAVHRCLTVAVAAATFLGADIAFAVGADETVRVPVEAPANGALSETVIVAKGDHLWKISKRHLETRMQRLPANSEINPYWREVIEQNLDNLRSGDPDLIYPGEVIEMPEARLSGQR